jgi:hypothetical protein
LPINARGDRRLAGFFIDHDIIEIVENFRQLPLTRTYKSE